ncbi:MAG TPA: ABC transporter permease [Bacillota bacterium]|jgi:peptide/nickel transport system permease protein
MRLLNYVLRRLALLIPVLIGVTLLTFIISVAVPGDPAQMMAGAQAKPEIIAALRHKLGMDEPWPIRYVYYLRDLARGDLGDSLQTGRPVARDLLNSFPATFELGTTAVVLAMVFGVPFGVISAYRKDKLPDHVSRFVALSGVAMPSFWLGLMLLMVFYVFLGILPGDGRLSIFADAPRRITGLFLVDSLLQLKFATFWEALLHLIMPAVTLGAALIGMVTRNTRSSMLEALSMDYVRTARSKGLAERIVVYKHALRNALLPVITVLGMVYGYALGGSVLVESVFSWPGMGRYAVQAIQMLDFPAVMGFTVFIAVVYVMVNLVVDVLYFYIDPRIKVH